MSAINERSSGQEVESTDQTVKLGTDMLSMGYGQLPKIQNNNKAQSSLPLRARSTNFDNNEGTGNNPLKKYGTFEEETNNDG